MSSKKESPSNSREVQGATEKITLDKRLDYTADAELTHDSKNAAWVKALQDELAKLDGEGDAR
jgi:hypothetical protein